MYCADCGTDMRQVSYIFAKDSTLLGTLYQCPKCQRVDYEEYKEK